jgi:hypothetical protein
VALITFLIVGHLLRFRESSLKFCVMSLDTTMDSKPAHGETFQCVLLLDCGPAASIIARALVYCDKSCRHGNA